MTGRRTHFNMTLNKVERTLLEDLAQHRGVSQGAMIRTLIRDAHQMICAGVPMCANGHHCLVPHMHSQLTGLPTAPTATSHPIPTPTA